MANHPAAACGNAFAVCAKSGTAASCWAQPGPSSLAPPSLPTPCRSARFIGNAGFSIGIDDVTPAPRLLEAKAKTLDTG